MQTTPASDSCQIQTLSRPDCLLCGGSGQLLHTNMVDRWFRAPGIWNLRLCTNGACGLCWLDPAPIKEDIHLLYETYFTHGDGSSGRNLLASLRSFLYSGYIAATWIPSMLLGVQRARRQILQMYLNDLKPGKLLDIGCGNGDFLHQMHGMGWSGTGTDFDGKAIENAKARYGSALTFLHTDLAEAKFPNNSFDAVTLSHVVEHVPDPVAQLKEVRRILRVGGQLTVTTPNIRSYGHELFQDCWSGLDSPRHLQIFSLAALGQCASKAGFEVIQTTSSVGRADTFIGGSFYFMEAKNKGICTSELGIPLNFLRGLRSLFLQYREARLLRHNPECGEEAVLICHK